MDTRELPEDFKQACEILAKKQGLSAAVLQSTLNHLYVIVSTGVTKHSARFIMEMMPEMARMLADSMGVAGQQWPAEIASRTSKHMSAEEVIRVVRQGVQRMEIKSLPPSVFANEEHCGYCGSKDHTRDTCKHLSEAYTGYKRLEIKSMKVEDFKVTGDIEAHLNLPAQLYTSPAAVLKSPTAHSLLQLEPGTECPICMSKVVSIESLGAMGWRCSCATCYEVTDMEDPVGPSCCAPCEDSIEQAVEVWMEEMREFAEEIQDVRIPFVQTRKALLAMAADKVFKTHTDLLSQLKD